MQHNTPSPSTRSTTSTSTTSPSHNRHRPELYDHSANTTAPSQPFDGPIPAPTVQLHHPDAERVRKAINRRSFATLATTSPAGRPHVAGVLFEPIGDVLYINTMRSSRKARNVAANPHVAVCLPIRRLPVGPPSTVQFQATAVVVDLDDPEITSLVEQGRLKSITSHSELDHPDGCFLRIAFGPRLVTYGLGMTLRKLIADPLNAGGSVVLERSAGARSLPSRTS